MSSCTRLLLSLFGTSISKNLSPAPIPVPVPALPFRFSTTKLFPSPVTLRFHRCYAASSSASIIDTAVAIGDTTTEEIAVNSSEHPWPEWMIFVDRLKTKGYLLDEKSGNSEEVGGVYKNMSILKDACLSFSRDRYDIFKSLSREDIQTVVEKGCPNINRKTVNSGKRLRAYVRLDEGEVCSGCNLRGSCDRAYVILKEAEVDARTVDIVRILLNYALDPLVISGEKPSDTIEISARKLLSELTELSDTTLDPEVPKPAPKVTHPKAFKDHEFSSDVEMKRGDWMCSKCNFMNFARNLRCLKCSEAGPLNVSGDGGEMKKGDWICSECTFMNFARNVRCLKCKAEGPERVGIDDVQMKKGDWNCPECHFMNFASNTKCKRCRQPRPKRQLNPGEWECPSCDFLNYRKNAVCLKCNCERPKDVEAKYEEQLWRKPF